MSRSTASELFDFIYDGSFPIELRDPKSGEVLHTLTSEDSLLPFEVIRPNFHVEDGALYDRENDEEISVDEVRKALLLVAKAVRTKKAITVEFEDDGYGESTTGYSYTIVAGANGSVQYGCQKYTAAQVKEVAAAIKASRKK